MAEIKTCIFDLDGVICDTARFHYIAWKALAKTLGFDLSHDHDEQMKGIGRMQSLELILDWANITLPLAQKEALCVEKNKCFVESIQSIKPSDMLPGVEAFLQELKLHNYKIALGSASKNAPLILDKLGITHYFDALVDGNSVSKAKPNPEVFIKGAELTNTATHNCVVFEDAISGVQAALNAKMYVIGVGKPEVLSKAHLCISTFEHFPLSCFTSL